MGALKKVYETHMKSKEGIIRILRQEERSAAYEYPGKMRREMRAAQAQGEISHVPCIGEYDLAVTSKDSADGLFDDTSNEGEDSWQHSPVASSGTSASSSAQTSRDGLVKPSNLMPVGECNWDNGHRLRRPLGRNPSGDLEGQLTDSYGVPAEYVLQHRNLRNCGVGVGYIKQRHLEKGACPVRPPSLRVASAVSMEDHATQRTVTMEDVSAVGIDLKELEHAAQEDCETGSGKGLEMIFERFKSLHPDNSGIDADDGSRSFKSWDLILKNYQKCIKDKQVVSEPGHSVDQGLTQRTYECSDTEDVDYMDVDLVPTVHRSAQHATPWEHEDPSISSSTATHDWDMEENEATLTGPIKRVRHLPNRDSISDKIATYDFAPKEFVELPNLDFNFPKSFSENMWNASLLNLPAGMRRPCHRPSKIHRDSLIWHNHDRHNGAPRSTKEAKSSLQEARSSSVVERWKEVDLASQMRTLSRPSSLNIVVRGVMDLSIATQACENGKAGVVAIEHERIQENMQHTFSAEDFKRAHPCLVIVYRSCELKNGTIILQSDGVAQHNDVEGPENLLETTLDRILSYVQVAKWKSLRTIVVAQNSALLSVGQRHDLRNLTLVKGVEPTYSHLSDLVRSRLLLVRMIFHSLRPSSGKPSPVEINFPGHDRPGDRLTPGELLEYDANCYTYRAHAHYAAFRFLACMYPFSPERIVLHVRNPLYCNEIPKLDLKLAQSYAFAVMLETFRPNCLKDIELVRQEATMRPFITASQPTLVITLPEAPYWASEAASVFVEKTDSTVMDFTWCPKYAPKISAGEYVWKEIMSKWQNFYQGLEPKVVPTVIIAAKSEELGLGYAFRAQKSRRNVNEVLRMFQGHPWVNIVILSDHGHNIVQTYETGIENGRITPSQDKRIRPKRVTLVSTTLQTTNRPLRNLLSKGMTFLEQCLALAVSNSSATMVVAVSAREYYCVQTIKKDDSGTFWTFDKSPEIHSMVKKFFSENLGIKQYQRSDIELACKLFHLIVLQVQAR